MAEENTTDLTPTPTETGTTPDPAASSSSTTPDPAKADDGETVAETILTPAADDGDAPKEDGDEPKEQTEEEKAAAEAQAKLYGAPEGDYEVTDLPEGMEIDKDALAVVTPIAKELNLSNEGFNKLAGVYAEKIIPGVQAKVTEGIEREVAAKHAEWAGEAQTMIAEDPVFKGKKLAEVQQMSAKTLDRFFGEEMRQFLAETGLGNHPAMVKGMYLIGTQIAEDTTFERGGPSAAPKSRTEKFYGKQST